MLRFFQRVDRWRPTMEESSSSSKRVGVSFVKKAATKSVDEENEEDQEAEWTEMSTEDHASATTTAVSDDERKRSTTTPDGEVEAEDNEEQQLAERATKSTDDHVSAMTTAISDYERKRLETIAKNEKMMRELGLNEPEMTIQTSRPRKSKSTRKARRRRAKDVSMTSSKRRRRSARFKSSSEPLLSLPDNFREATRTEMVGVNEDTTTYVPPPPSLRRMKYGRLSKDQGTSFARFFRSLVRLARHNMRIIFSPRHRRSANLTQSFANQNRTDRGVPVIRRRACGKTGRRDVGAWI